jgi:hypothetical protein
MLWEGGSTPMLNELYLAPAVKEELAQTFAREGVVRIDHFFELQALVPLTHAFTRARERAFFQAHLHSFQELLPSSFLRSFFTGAVLRGFLGSCRGKRVSRISFTCRRFGAGDFTLRHDRVRLRGVHFYFFLTNPWDVSWGGTVTLTRPGQAPVLLHPFSNTLYVVRSTVDMRAFVSYINHHAQRRSFVLVEGVIH